jgi:hypothetical protein
LPLGVNWLPGLNFVTYVQGLFIPSFPPGVNTL